MRIVQLSDLHLLASASERLRGVPTRDSFIDVMRHLDETLGDVDRLVITGDLTHDGRVETYDALRTLLGDRIRDCRLIPGNHDDRAAMRSVFPELVPRGNGPLTFSEELAGWRLIGLDSHVAGEVGGRIDLEQYEWLADELACAEGRPTLLFLHHPPISVGSAWLDAIALEETERLARIVGRAPHLRGIFVGHIHQVFEGEFHGVPVWSVPSTGVQFRPQTAEPVYEASAPGFRLLEIQGDTLQTTVIRLGTVHFPPTAE